MIKRNTRKNKKDHEYRGVFINTNQLQVKCYLDGRQEYVANFDDIILAAIVYDIIHIQNNGIDVKTNFSYRLIDLLGILVIGSLLDMRAESVT